MNLSAALSAVNVYSWIKSLCWGRTVKHHLAMSYELPCKHPFVIPTSIKVRTTWSNTPRMVEYISGRDTGLCACLGAQHLNLPSTKIIYFFLSLAAYFTVNKNFGYDTFAPRLPTVGCKTCNGTEEGLFHWTHPQRTMERTIESRK